MTRTSRGQARGSIHRAAPGRPPSPLGTPAIATRTDTASSSAHTLQDRLVKELRLRGISDQDAGNAYLDEFREDYNRRFARPAKNPRNAHRPLLPSDDLRRSLTWQEQRRLTNNLTLHYKRVLYVIDPTPAAERARGHRVDIRENEDGSIQEYLGTELTAYAFAKDAQVNPGAIVENKLLGHTLRLIADAQRECDESRLDNQRMTLREQDKLRRAMAAGFDGGSTSRSATSTSHRPTPPCGSRSPCPRTNCSHNHQSNRWH